MSIGERIKSTRKGKYTQAELAEILGVHETTIRRWESGRDDGPKEKMLSRLASALNTTVAYLTGETDNPERTAPQTAPTPPAQKIESNVRPVVTVKVPLIGGVIKACCGPGNAYAEDVEWEVVGEIDIPYSDLIGYAWQVGDGGFRTMRVEGNSMEPRIHDGDMILFARLPLNNGNFALVQYDGRLIVRAVWNDQRGHYKLRALNSAYKDIDVDSEDEAQDFIILGKVIRRITTENLADGMM